MIFGPSGHVHDPSNQLFLTFNLYIYLKEFKKKRINFKNKTNRGGPVAYQGADFQKTELPKADCVLFSRDFPIMSKNGWFHNQE